MNGMTLDKSVVGFGGASLAVAVMFLVLVGYLIVTYATTGIVVALLATAVVVVTGGIPYVVMRRRCAREACAREAAAK